MRTILCIVLGLFIAQKCMAQQDSLVIKLENYGQMVIISPNLTTEKQKSLGLDSSFHNFYLDFKRIDKSKFNEGKLLIRYSYKKYEPQYRKMSIEENSEKKEEYFYHGENQGIAMLGRLRFELSFEREVVINTDSLNNLEKIDQLDLDNLYLQALADFQSKKLHKRVPYKTFYSLENNQLNKNSNMTYNGGFQDYLILNANVGMSFVGSSFAPEWGANIELDFRKKGLPNLKFGLNYKTMYLSDADDFFNISSYAFLNLNYYFKSSKSYSHKVGVGYLVNKNGEHFNGNTWTACFVTNLKNIGFKFAGFYTKNLEGKYIVMPSVGIEVGF